jgi:hypothetical protein
MIESGMGAGDVDCGRALPQEKAPEHNRDIPTPETNNTCTSQGQRSDDDFVNIDLVDQFHLTSPFTLSSGRSIPYNDI